MEKSNPELSSVFKEGNSRWTKIMDAEAVDDFVNTMFEGKLNFKKMHDFFDKSGYDFTFKRALGEKGYKDFEVLMKDMLTSEAPYKMLKIAKEKGWQDLFQTGLGYVLHPKIGQVKAGIDATKYVYRGLLNSMLDKPQIGMNFKKAVMDLKKGDFKAADKEFKALHGQIETVSNEAPKTALNKSSINDAFAQMGGGMVDNLYNGLFESLQKGRDTFAGVKDPILIKAKPLYDKGIIKSPNDLKDYVNGKLKS